MKNPRPRYDNVPFVIRPRSEDMAGLEQPQERHDGWFEIELGEFQSGDGDDEVEMSLNEVNGTTGKIGLVVEGIEIRRNNFPFHFHSYFSPNSPSFPTETTPFEPSNTAQQSNRDGGDYRSN